MLTNGNWITQLPEIPPRINILGVGVHAINQEKTLNLVFNALRSKSRGYICVTSAHGIIEAQEDPSFRKILNDSFLTVPDGMPLVWTGKLMGVRTIGRVYGPDLMRQICDQGRNFGVRHFLYGGRSGVVELLKARLEVLYPGVKVVGIFTPPFRPLNENEKAELIKAVEKAQPDIIWVGLSTPKQEKFMHEYLHILPTTLMLGVGAAFDLISGLVPEAPQWMQHCGLEWLFRLCVEPRRLWKRYTKIVPRYPVLVALQLLGLKKYHLHQPNPLKDVSPPK